MTLSTLFLLFAPSGGSGGPGFGIFLFQMAAFIGIIYFLLIRPRSQEEKRHRARLAEITRGDRVVTNGGIVGEVVKVKDDELTIKSGESRLVIQRGRVAEVHTPGTAEETKRS